MTLRTLDEDNTCHFSSLKKLALSGTQYLHAVNVPLEPTRDMLIGTVVHFLLLGARPGSKPLVCYRGGVRRGKEWEAFKADNASAEIVSETEWAEAEGIVQGVRSSPVAVDRLTGSRFEVPLAWEENGIKCSTSGIDILGKLGDLCDLKTTSSTHPDTWMRQAFRMLYPQQMAWYRRGARANGVDVRGLFLLGVERKAPHEVVELELTEHMIAFADRSIDLWLERLRVLRESIPEPKTVYDWPGYAQAPVPFDVPGWADRDDEDDDEAA